MASFFSALLGGRLLRPDLLAELETLVSSSQYGLGLASFRTRCGPAYGHLGDVPGYRNEVLATPDGQRVVEVMVNVDDSFLSFGNVESAAETAFCAR